MNNQNILSLLYRKKLKKLVSIWERKQILILQNKLIQDSLKNEIYKNLFNIKKSELVNLHIILSLIKIRNK